MTATHVRLTEAQHELLTAIRRYHAQHHFCPTVRELMKLTQASSTSVVHHRLNHLQALGLVTWEPWVARTIRVNETAFRQGRKAAC